MISISAVNSIFLEGSAGEYPFRNTDWIAVAFERNSYDNTRMPEWFFRAVSDHFRSFSDGNLLIAGDCFIGSGLQELCSVSFDWEEYRKFMLRPEAYSVEYKMASADLQCGCMADADITVFGGNPVRMSAVFDDLGGAEKMLQHMRQEFLLGDVATYKAMDVFFQGLLSTAVRRNE